MMYIQQEMAATLWRFLKVRKTFRIHPHKDLYRQKVAQAPERFEYSTHVCPHMLFIVHALTVAVDGRQKKLLCTQA